MKKLICAGNLQDASFYAKYCSLSEPCEAFAPGSNPSKSLWQSGASFI